MILLSAQYVMKNVSFLEKLFVNTDLSMYLLFY